MRGKTSHTSKTVAERINYQKALAKVDTEPTIDESIDFKQSNKMDEEKEGTGLVLVRNPCATNLVDRQSGYLNSKK